ncbi:MAG: protein kinase [Kofleriaceae bacterium]|nr:protein kinase [Kofleriaceae bacterium]
MAGPDLSGEVLDRRYRILDRLSSGAMGVVYRGVRTKLERPVAIKVMHLALPSQMKARERFEREAQVMARLDHPHCVSIIDYGIHQQKPYVVMELVRGQSLHDMIGELGRIEIPRAVDIMRQILSGLAHAHEQGIIHRDIKPANIMVTPKAPLGLHVRILDFGLARMLSGSSSVSNGVAVGTPSYMAPEQARGETLDATVDIYACGIVLFEMLTGKKPLTASDPIQTLKKQTDEMPPRLSDVVPGDYGALEDIVARALEKNPADRFQSAIAMSEALDAAVGGAVTTAAESTAVLPVTGDPSDDDSGAEAEPVEKHAGSNDSSAMIPITLATSAFVMKPRPRPDDKPITRPNAPRRSRLPLVLLLLLLIGGGVAGAVMLLDSQKQPEQPAEAKPVVDEATPVAQAAPTPSPVDAAADPVADMIGAAQALAADGKTDRALDVVLAARAKNRDRADVALLAGKLYFSKYWWTDGIAMFREAIKLDASLRDNKELVDLAVRGFLTTPDYDSRLASFVLELPAAQPLLDELSRTHRVPQKRSRAGALARRMLAKH